MSDGTIRVVVASGQTLTIAPHPSGIAGMPPLTLFGGQAARVTPERAEKLIRDRIVLDPATGSVRPELAHRSAPAPLVVRTGESWEAMAARAEAERASQPPATRPRRMVLDPFGGRHHYEPHDPQTTPQHHDFGSGARTVEVD